MKKIIFIIISILVISSSIGLVLIKKGMDSMDQVKLQYENEVISTLKRPLLFEPFETALAGQTVERKEYIRGLVLGEDVTEVQALVAKGQLTVEELVLFYVDRIKENDSYYNSVIQLNPLALKEARELDKRIAENQEIGRLSGLVVLIKDNVAEQSMNTAAGADVLKQLTTSRDAFVVSTLKAEDAIILGKNNLSEWSNFMSMPSSNGFSTLGGQTKNAYGRYDVGGSSSGPAVAVAMNFASVTIGSETAGSLIYPASQNSVVAIKPTLGLLSRDLVIPISEAQDTLGLMGRRVTDVYAVFSSIVAVDESDSKSEFAKIYLEREAVKGTPVLNKDYLRGKRIGVLNGESSAQTQLIQELESLGATVIELELDQGELEIDMMSVLNYGMVHDLELFLENDAVNSPVQSLKEIITYNKNKAEIRMPYGELLLEGALDQKNSKKEIEAIIDKNRLLSRDALNSLIEDNQIEVIASFSNELSGIYAPAGYPAITVPAGYRENGEPYGVTFVAKALEDQKLFQVAYAYEKGTKHRKVAGMIVK